MSVLDDLAAAVMDMTPAELDALASTLDPDDLALLERAVAEQAATHWRADPLRMAMHLQAKKWQQWRYVQVLSDAFRRAVLGQSRFQMWMLPSRYGKTVWSSIWGPVWAFDHDPTLRLMLTGYSDGLVKSSARQARDLLQQHRGLLRAQLRPDVRAAGAWATDEGGGLYAAGTDGTIAGLPADGLVWDDPVKNWQEAHSAAHREHLMNVWRSVLRFRLESDRAFAIIAGYRTHPQDPQGQLLAEMLSGGPEQWEVIRIPSLAHPPSEDPNDPPWLRQPDPLGREPGEVIEPERFSMREVMSRRLSAGSYLSAAMEDQNPQPEEGGKVKRDWWKLETTPITAADEWISAWDMKLKEKRKAEHDFQVGQVWGRVGSHVWCVAQLRGQWTQFGAKCAIALLSVRHPQVPRHCIENTGNAPEVMEQLEAGDPEATVSDEVAGELGMTDAEREAVQAILRRGMPGLIPQTPKGSKESRVYAVGGYIEAGNVHLAPKDAPWVGQLVGEAAAFPTGDHDDSIDTAAMGIGLLLGSGGPATVSVATGAKLPEVAIGPGSGAGGLRLPQVRIG